MDFFQAQDQAHRNSRSLFFLFLLAVAALICGAYIALILILGFVGAGGIAGEPALFLGVAGAMLLLIGGGSVYRTAQLRSGGGSVARLMAGRRVEPDTADLAESRLRNVVEEMSIASGVPVPEIYVLDGEEGINAFAAGHTPHDAAVAVSRGVLNHLDREELQGVVAHEFSHILNGDMKLNIRLIGVLFGIFLLSVTGRGIIRGTRRSRGRGIAQASLFGVALVLLGTVGVFVGRLIQAAVSRQREYLADASAVQFTRNPAGIAGALRKIQLGPGSTLQTSHAQEAAHLFFANGLGRAYLAALATHPPLEERIRRLDPGGLFTGVSSTGDAPSPASSPPVPPLGLTSTLPPLSALAGLTGSRQLHQAGQILAELPEGIRESARNPQEAEALLLGLILAGSEIPRDQALELTRRRMPPQLAAQVESRCRQLEPLAPGARLPLLDLTLPALRTLPEREARTLLSALSEIVRIDGKVLPFEFAVFHSLRRNLQLGTPSAPRRRGGRSRDRDRMQIVLSAVAWSGAESEAEARSSFEEGLRRGGALGELLPRGACGLGEVDAALQILEESPPQLRKRLLDLAQLVVAADHEIRLQEIEMIRAVAEALDVPIPPLAGR